MDEITAQTKDSALTWHFNPRRSCEDKHCIDDMRIILLGAVPNSYSKPIAEKKLKEIETEWIIKLGTLRPVGMNVQLIDTIQRTQNTE